MSDIKISAFDLDGLPESGSSVANNLINKVSSAIGWVCIPKGLRKAQEEAKASIIEEIASRDDINPIERFAIVSDIKRIVKEYKNKTDIVRIAIDNIEPEAKPEKIDDDWLSYYFDNAKKISSIEMQLIWGRILAEEANKPNSVPKGLLHI